ncbi:hypothetical protein BU17DRAFT_101911 [Hysterangium stoloniferum]|nr:hypothetical protein BU17DRAFT_101911 [Hysterangium stoloniferum]
MLLMFPQTEQAATDLTGRRHSNMGHASGTPHKTHPTLDLSAFTSGFDKAFPRNTSQPAPTYFSHPFPVMERVAAPSLFVPLSAVAPPLFPSPSPSLSPLPPPPPPPPPPASEDLQAKLQCPTPDPSFHHEISEGLSHEPPQSAVAPPLSPSPLPLPPLPTSKDLQDELPALQQLRAEGEVQRRDRSSDVVPAGNLKPQQPVTNTLWRSLGAYVQRADILGPVEMVMPDTPEEDGTTGTREVPRSLPRSDWQLHFENVIVMVATTTLHNPTDNSEVYSSHPYGDLRTNRIIASRVWSVYSVHVQNGRVRVWFVGSLDKPAQVGWRLMMLLWEFSEAIGEAARWKVKDQL